MRRVVAVFALAIGFAAAVHAQQKRPDNDHRSTDAYAEVLLRRTEVAAEAEALLADYTETNPRILDLRYEQSVLDDFLKKVPTIDRSALTAALGKLVVTRAALDTELHRLARTLNVDHPDYKRAKKRLDVFDAAIKQIIP